MAFRVRPEDNVFFTKGFFCINVFIKQKYTIFYPKRENKVNLFFVVDNFRVIQRILIANFINHFHISTLGGDSKNHSYAFYVKYRLKTQQNVSLH